MGCGQRSRFTNCKTHNMERETLNMFFINGLPYTSGYTYASVVNLLNQNLIIQATESDKNTPD